ncbi:MAG: bifunctional lysine ketoglutarate reductase /saccharopine dehydrogenase family protein [Ignavibacteriales bacterium]|nr:bifunctional lysine ketoglutarate reductase /saccharopine dehydrogenase family protein [Ignavibacteriales bacterium]
MVIGIRREDKNEWERRVPLVPKDLKELKEKYGIETVVQSSPIRFFNDDDFKNEGISIDEDISIADTVFSVKEIPLHYFQKGKTYVFFAHVIKGQQYNMPMLRRMMDLECSLIDYERIVNEKNQRLIFFGKYAGNAGMIETLHLLGQKLKLEGYKTPFENIKQPYQYASLEEAKEDLRKISEIIKSEGLPSKITPIIIGFAGYGNVSKGAQEIFDILPNKIIPADMLTRLHDSLTLDSSNLYKVVFKEEDMVERKDKQPFERQEYFEYPERFESIFEKYIPFLSVLINCIFWTEKYPKFVTKSFLQNDYVKQSRQKLKIIGDISCDINGSIEITYKATKPDNPAFTYNFKDDSFKDGVHNKGGITVMAVDNLPCEFPGEASIAFSSVLKEFAHQIAKADFHNDFDELELPEPIKRALVLHKGKLTKDYQYLSSFLNKEEK